MQLGGTMQYSAHIQHDCSAAAVMHLDNDVGSLQRAADAEGDVDHQHLHRSDTSSVRQHKPPGGAGAAARLPRAISGCELSASCTNQQVQRRQHEHRSIRGQGVRTTTTHLQQAMLLCQVGLQLLRDVDHLRVQDLDVRKIRFTPQHRQDSQLITPSPCVSQHRSNANQLDGSASDTHSRVLPSCCMTAAGRCYQVHLLLFQQGCDSGVHLTAPCSTQRQICGRRQRWPATAAAATRCPAVCAAHPQAAPGTAAAEQKTGNVSAQSYAGVMQGVRDRVPGLASGCRGVKMPGDACNACI